MKRREFIKGSAIIGATVTIPTLLKGESGMFESKKERAVYRVITANKTMVGTLPVLRAFAGDNNDYVSPFVFFDTHRFGFILMKPNGLAATIEIFLSLSNCLVRITQHQW